MPSHNQTLTTSKEETSPSLSSGYEGVVRQTDRQVSDTLFIRHQLNHKNRSRVSASYIFAIADYKRLAPIQLKCQLKKSINRSDFLRLLEGRMDPALDNYATSVFSTVKGHRSYWEQRRQEIITNVRAANLNPAEYYWSEVVELHKSVYHDLEAIGVQAKVAEDPMPFCKANNVDKNFS